MKSTLRTDFSGVKSVIKVIGFRVRLQKPKSGFQNLNPDFPIERNHSDCSVDTMVSLPLRELNVRIRNLARIAFLFLQLGSFFRLFFLSFSFNFFFIIISFSELPVITVSLFIQIDCLVHVMSLDGQLPNAVNSIIMAITSGLEQTRRNSAILGCLTLSSIFDFTSFSTFLKFAGPSGRQKHPDRMAWVAD